MAKKTRDKFWRLNNPIMWGVLATATVIVFGVWAANLSVCHTDFWGNQRCGGSKWSVFLEAAPNEVGDTLAGFAGALAFVWLIATVWLQGQELAEQRKELREQRLATRDMADAQKEQVDLMLSQGNLLAQQIEDLKRQRADQSCEEMLNSLYELILSLKTPIFWGPRDSTEVKFYSPRHKGEPRDAYLTEACRDLASCLRQVIRKGHSIVASDKGVFVGPLDSQLEAIWNSRLEISDAQTKKLKRLKVWDCAELLQRECLWAESEEDT